MHNVPLFLFEITMREMCVQCITPTYIGTFLILYSFENMNTKYIACKGDCVILLWLMPFPDMEDA